MLQMSAIKVGLHLLSESWINQSHILKAVQQVYLWLRQNRAFSTRALYVLVMMSAVCALQNGAVTSASAVDMDKIKSILKQIVRDWSKEGEGERISCYQPVIHTITRLFPSDQWSVSMRNNQNMNMLVL